MNPIDAYNQKAADYATYRPQYAAEAFEILCRHTGLGPNWLVADIGAGTGNVSRHLVCRASRVFAVEPNEAMRRQAEHILNHHNSFTSIAATAEHTSLPSRSIDLLTVGQALHWFDPEATRMEFARILKLGGWVAILWNRFDRDNTPDVKGFFPDVCFHHFSFQTEVHETWQQFLGGARSAAGAPSEGDDGYGEFVTEQRKIFDAGANKGIITIEYSTELFAGQCGQNVHDEKSCGQLRRRRNLPIIHQKRRA